MHVLKGWGNAMVTSMRKTSLKKLVLKNRLVRKEMRKIAQWRVIFSFIVVCCEEMIPWPFVENWVILTVGFSDLKLKGYHQA